MSNWDREIGRQFARRSFHAIATLQTDKRADAAHGANPAAPRQSSGCTGQRSAALGFKIYRDLPRLPLSEPPQLNLGDARDSFEGFAARAPRSSTNAREPDAQPLDARGLSTFLYYTYGVSRFDLGSHVAWPFHRFVPSARCFFPMELYVSIPGGSGLPAGLFAYDGLHHSLVRLRDGDHHALLSRDTGSSLGSASVVLLLGARFAKNAWRYGSFSYRLTTQEAGILAAQALIVGAALGLQGHVHYHFLDRPLAALLGFAPSDERVEESVEESVLAVVPLYAAGTSDPVIERTSTSPSQGRPDSGSLEPLHTHALLPQQSQSGSYPALAEIERHSWLDDPAEITAHPPSAPACQGETRIDAAPPTTEPLDLARALFARNSGDVDFRPLQSSLAHDRFWEILRYALRPYVSDLHDGPGSPHVQLVAAVSRVDGLQPGIYRVCAACGGLHPHRLGNWVHEAGELRIQDNIHWRAAPLICYLIGDYGEAIATYGNRGYRIMNMESGLVSQRIGVLCGAFGLSARISNGLSVPAVSRLLGLTGEEHVPLCEIVIGAEAAGAYAAGRYRMAALP